MKKKWKKKRKKEQKALRQALDRLQLPDTVKDILLEIWNEVQDAYRSSLHEHRKFIKNAAEWSCDRDEHGAHLRRCRACAAFEFLQ